MKKRRMENLGFGVVVLGVVLFSSGLSVCLPCSGLAFFHSLFFGVSRESLRGLNLHFIASGTFFLVSGIFISLKAKKLH